MAKKKGFEEPQNENGPGLCKEGGKGAKAMPRGKAGLEN